MLLRAHDEVRPLGHELLALRTVVGSVALPSMGLHALSKQRDCMSETTGFWHSSRSETAALLHVQLCSRPVLDQLRSLTLNSISCMLTLRTSTLDAMSAMARPTLPSATCPAQRATLPPLSQGRGLRPSTLDFVGCMPMLRTSTLDATHCDGKSNTAQQLHELLDHPGTRMSTTCSTLRSCP